MQTTDFENQKKEKKDNPLFKWVILLGILTVIFMGTTVYFAKFYSPSFNNQVQNITSEKETMEQNLNKELADLLAQHNALKVENGELAAQLTEKDSIILANADEIQKLINSQGDYKKIKKQLARLQNIAQEYVAEMDKLIEQNRVLTSKNTELTETIAKEQSEKVRLTQEKDELNQKINTAATLSAYNIYSRCVYHKSRNNAEVITERANRAKKIKTTLILGENSLITPGTYNIYCRVSVPGDGRVLTPGKSDAYTFINEGKKLQYTAKAEVQYVNKKENVTLVWDIRENDKAIKGTYNVQVFSDTKLLGETSFTLE
ncbi:MAG: hypothetical protein PHQ33_00045 [Bacteroidales bacterium]|jgi:peptidoglycan hydrolase CwlO-like protein|nr:hypothetical protein [Bacteroidales bacterium]MDD4394270.1 hypothetical protein [Bacteroidales bacterium]